MKNLNRDQVRTAALIIIGSEILSGRIQDTNTQWIAEKLNERGIVLDEVRIVPDRHNVIISTVQELSDRMDYVLTTGGIGPTHDDITAECVAQAFEVNVERNSQARERLSGYYGEDNLSEARLKMARMPEGATLIENPVTGAPGFRIGNVYALAGVPRIMQAMLNNLLEDLEAGQPIISNTVSCNLSESVVSPELKELQDKYGDVDFASYPHYRSGVMGLSLVLRSTNNETLDHATQELIGVVRKLGDEPKAISVRSDAENALDLREA
jgi:molybdenum cofactor synthesis domain-containing protein